MPLTWEHQTVPSEGAKPPAAFPDSTHHERSLLRIMHLSPLYPRILVIYRHFGADCRMRDAVYSHLHTLDGLPAASILYFNAALGVPSWLRHYGPHAVVLHTTFLGMRWLPLFPLVRRQSHWLAELNVPVVALPQDEYDHAHILDQWLSEMGTSSVYSNFGSDHWPMLYPVVSKRARMHECLTGYISSETAERVANGVKDWRERTYDVVYRATRLPYWFGTHGQLKHEIADVTIACASAMGLKYDISTDPQDTILGADWLSFLGSGRAVVGTESGSSVLDPTGAIRHRIRALLRQSPGLTLAEISEHMPPGWDQHAFLALSPRHLEAVITKTCQILVDGRYSGVLVPGRHYISLRRDFSNMRDALASLVDGDRCRERVDQAYRDVWLSGKYTYLAFGGRILEEIMAGHGLQRRAVPTPSAASLFAVARLAAARGLLAGRLAGFFVNTMRGIRHYRRQNCATRP